MVGRIRASISRLTERERTMLAALLGSLFVCAAAILIVLIIDGMGGIEERNRQMRDALSAIASGRESYLEQKRQGTNLRSRRPAAPALQGYLEKAASDVGISIPESNERAATPRGKRHVERAVDIKLRDVDLEQLARFLHQVENGQYLVVTSQLGVRPRYGNRERLDVEVTVSTFERAEPSAAGGKGNGKDGKGGAKETEE